MFYDEDNNSAKFIEVNRENGRSFCRPKIISINVHRACKGNLEFVDVIVPHKPWSSHDSTIFLKNLMKYLLDTDG